MIASGIVLMVEGCKGNERAIRSYVASNLRVIRAKQRANRLRITRREFMQIVNYQGVREKIHRVRYEVREWLDVREW